MSETTSAFAAYSTPVSKKGANKTKQNQKATNVGKSKNKTAATKAATTSKNANKNEKAPVTKKSIGAATAKDVPKVNGTTSKAPTKIKATGAKSTETKANALDQKAVTKGNVATSKKTTSKETNGNPKDAVASGTRSVRNKDVNQLNENNVDVWVDELMGGKSLNKKDKERKTLLENYLLTNQIFEHLKDEEGEMEEYTMNSYYEESDEEETSWSDVTEEGDEITTNDSYGSAALTQNKPSQKIAAKRKSTDDTNNNNGKAIKKSHTTGQTTKSPIIKTKSRQTIIESVTKATAGKERRLTVIDTGPSASTVGNQIIKKEPLSPASSIKTNSIEEGKKAFAWLISPIDVNDFFQNYWEKKACYIKRNSVNNFQHLISFTAIDQMLVNNHIEFTTNIDVTSYKNGIRETLNPEGRALPPSVWEHYSSGCSIRLLNPHTYIPNLFKLNAALQEFFHCLVGANAYLTPPNSQGFAPHYDDIEAFVLQIEGRKRWRLYKPLEDNDVLPRVSSRNFKPEEIGKPIFETVLMPGDILYFPRGVIHQASTETGYHSLHITLSVYQKQSYADLLEKLMPLVLEHAIKRNLSLRRGLPLNTFNHLGLVHSTSNSKERSDLQEKITMFAEKHLKLHSSLIDAAVDQLAKKYQHEALPPDMNSTETARTIRGSRTVTDSRGNCRCDYELQLTTNIRLLRANILRLVREDGGKYRVYFYVDNAREYCKYEPNFIEIQATEAGTIEMLVRSYPAYVGVSQFPIEDDERKLDVATALFERGLIMTEKPFR